MCELCGDEGKGATPMFPMHVIVKVYLKALKQQG